MFVRTNLTASREVGPNPSIFPKPPILCPIFFPSQSNRPPPLFSGVLVFDDRTAVDVPHAAIGFGSCGGRVVSGRVCVGVVTRGVSRRVVSKSSWDTVSLGRSLPTETAPLLPSYEETVSIESTHSRSRPYRSTFLSSREPDSWSRAS